MVTGNTMILLMALDLAGVSGHGAGFARALRQQDPWIGLRTQVQRLNQRYALLEDCTLVDRSFVGHLAVVDRWRFREDVGTRDAIGAAGAGTPLAIDKRLEKSAHRRGVHDVGGGSASPPPRKAATLGEAPNAQDADLVPPHAPAPAILQVKRAVEAAP